MASTFPRGAHDLICDVLSKMTLLKLQPQYGGVEWEWHGLGVFSMADGPMALDIREFGLTLWPKTYFMLRKISYIVCIFLNDKFRNDYFLRLFKYLVTTHKGLSRKAELSLLLGQRCPMNVMASQITGNPTRKGTLHYWPFVMGIQRWPSVPLTKGQWCGWSHEFIIYTHMKEWSWSLKPDRGETKRYWA